MGRVFDKAHLFDGFTYDRDCYGKGPGYDPAIIAEGLAPITEVERCGMAQLSDVDLEILQHKLTSVVEEAHDVYKELSISEAVMSGDMNCGILTASGDPAVVATGIYFHAMLNTFQAKYILRYYKDDPTVGLKDGDLYFFNDELSGGTHNYDMFSTMPIFYRDRLVAWATCGGHQGDTGSISPGGFAPTARSRFEEGFRILQMRIGEHFQIRTDIMDFLCEAVRNPLVFAADLKARLATCMRIRERLLREIERRGVEPVVGGLRKLLVVAEERARERIRALPDGIFRSVIFLDNLGNELGLSRIPTTVFKQDDELTLLVNGVSPEAPCGPMNATWHLVRAALGVYLFSYFFRGLPPNAGLLEPVKVLSEGPSIANCTTAVARGLGTTVAACVVQNLHVIGSKMVFASPYRESTAVPFSRNVLVLVFAGENRRGYQQANPGTSGNASGQGAQFDHDGEDAFGFFWGACVDSGEAEVVDSRYPNFTLMRTVECNSHGFGKYRGGVPMVDITLSYGAKGCFMTSWGSSDKLSHNPGLFGGYWGPPNNRVTIHNSNLRELFATSDPKLNFDTGYELLTERAIEGDYEYAPSSVNTQSFKDGDIFIQNAGGAGGYGDVLEREPQAVLHDVRSKAISPDVAYKTYGVVIDESSGEVDLQATEQRRLGIRRERLAQGRPFAEFVRQWSQKRPPAAILKYYGNWPDPQGAVLSRTLLGNLQVGAMCAALAKPGPRASFLPLLFRFAGRLEQMSWDEFTGDPASTALALRNAQAAVGADGLVNWFDTYAEAECLGLVAARDDNGEPLGELRINAGPIGLDGLSATLLPRLRELTARLAKERRPGTLLVAAATGPKTLLTRLWGQQSPDAQAAGAQRLALEQIVQWLVRLVRAYCEAGADLLLFAEEADALGEFYQGWGRLVEPVLKLARYYNRPCLLLSRAPMPEIQLAAARQVGLTASQDLPHLLASGAGADTPHIIANQTLALAEDQRRQALERRRAHPSGRGLYFSSWEIPVATEPERLIELGECLHGNV